MNHVNRFYTNIKNNKNKFFLLTLPMKMELTECSETSAHKVQMPENHPKKEYNIQNTAKV